jgi:hypothetical protein
MRVQKGTVQHRVVQQEIKQNMRGAFTVEYSTQYRGGGGTMSQCEYSTECSARESAM